MTVEMFLLMMSMMKLRENIANLGINMRESLNLAYDKTTLNKYMNRKFNRSSIVSSFGSIKSEYLIEI